VELTFKEAKQLPASYDGQVILELSAGTRFQIRNNETGDIVYDLNEVVPANKAWIVGISLSIHETDV